MNYTASAYASVMMVITAVFLLITAQLAVSSSEMNISRMHERYSGLYETGVSAAEARAGKINAAIRDNESSILLDYMDGNDWISQCCLQDDALVLTGEAFGRAYREIALNYADAPQVGNTVISQESGASINIQSNFGNPGTVFSITVTNNSLLPPVKNMTGAVKIEGEIIWNPDPPVFTLQPRFNIYEDTLDDKGFNDFIITSDPDYPSVVLYEIHQV